MADLFLLSKKVYLCNLKKSSEEELIALKIISSRKYKSIKQ